MLENLDLLESPVPDGPPFPTCSRCYDEVKEEELFSANCEEKPEKLIGAPIGMYHCPDCEAMVVAGLEHGRLCKPCLERRHPRFDKVQL